MSGGQRMDVPMSQLKKSALSLAPLFVLFRLSLAWMMPSCTGGGESFDSNTNPFQKIPPQTHPETMLYQHPLARSN